MLPSIPIEVHTALPPPPLSSPVIKLASPKREGQQSETANNEVEHTKPTNANSVRIRQYSEASTQTVQVCYVFNNTQKKKLRNFVFLL